MPTETKTTDLLELNSLVPSTAELTSLVATTVELESKADLELAVIEVEA
jgi:hypothetical protein